MPKFLFTDKLAVRKLESIIWNSLTSNLHVCPIYGGHSVTVWQCYPVVPVSHSPSTGTARNDSQASVWLPQPSGTKAMASDISLFFLLFSRNFNLDFQAQTLCSIQRCLCSAALLGLLALLLATASGEGSHPIFLIWLVLPAVLLSFLAYCWGWFCSLSVTHVLLHLWHSISCFLVCHWLVIVSDANLSSTNHLFLLFWTAFMSHICYLILVSHRLPPENKAVLSVMISSATITPLFYSEGYLQQLCFSLLDPGSNFLIMFVCFVLYLYFHWRKRSRSSIFILIL